MNYSEYNEQVLGWLDMVLANRGINAELTLSNCKLIEKYALCQNDQKLLGFAYYYAGETYYVLNDIERLFQNMTKALGHLEHCKHWELAARAYNLLGITSVNRGNAPFAMDYYLNGLSYCKKYDIADVGIIINMNIGTLYMTFGEYKQAQRYFEESFQLVSGHKNVDGYYSYLTSVYLGLAKCYMYRQMPDKTQEYIEKVQQECGGQLEDAEKMYLLIVKARMYNGMGKLPMRDACIREIQEKAACDFALMDLFDEFYEYGQMLYQIQQYEDFWEVINILENLTKKAKVINLQRRLLALKIKYYKATMDQEGYLQAAGLYYEMSEAMDKENRYMVSTMLDIRKTLDNETRIRREIQRENEALVEKSERDALTGLCNRFRLNTHAEEVFSKSLEQQTVMGIEILDIDFFKQYNDNYGHQAGDICLIKVADKIRGLEKHERVKTFRYGGDEFVILYEGYSKAEVKMLMEELKQSIMSINIEHKYSPADPRLTISQGACVDVPGRDNKVWDFLHAADTMLYQVKKCTRNSIAIGGCEQMERFDT